jgi:hypothetical protein
MRNQASAAVIETTLGSATDRNLPLRFRAMRNFLQQQHQATGDSAAQR